MEETSPDPATEKRPIADHADNESPFDEIQPRDYPEIPLQSSYEPDSDEKGPVHVPMPVGNVPIGKSNSPPPTSEKLPMPINTNITNDRTSNIPSPRSMTSDHQFKYGTSASSATDPPDRVFPIRSVISVDQSQPTSATLLRSSGEQTYLSRQEVTWDGRRRPSDPYMPPEKAGRLQRIETGLSPSSSSRGSPRGKDGPRRKDTISTSIGSLPPNIERIASAEPLPIFNYASSEGSDKTRGSASLRASESQAGRSGRMSPTEFNESLTTVRFRHVVTDEGHAVITGRDDISQRCEDEPIHTPGAVQAFGLLVALREEADGRLSVRCVSENSNRIIGFSPKELFRLESFTEIFTEEQADNLLDHIDFIRDEEADPATNGPDVFSISIRPPQKKSVKLWCAMHINDSHPDLIILEFELEDDQEHPLRPTGELNGDEPEDTLCQDPTMQELTESTEISSRPLRILRSARKKRGEAGAMQVFDIMSQVQEQLASAPDLPTFLKVLVGIVKELTGFHRVMMYQFDSAFNGKVVTELVDPSQTRDLYYGLHFPASDIPKQARDLYKLNKVRLLYDRDLESARLVCRSPEDLERPLDLSHAYLRAMSPIHLKYLANMAVRSSMSISINAFNELWGLIACHSYGSKGMRVSFPIRKLCRLIGDSASQNIERYSFISRLQSRKLINTMPTDKNPSGYITASSDDLINLFDADFGILSIRGETKILGKIEQSQEALAMLEYLRLRKFTSVLTSQDIREDFPDLCYPPGFSVIAGLLYVPLSLGGSDFIVFFRKGQTREVKWAGNPYEKVVKEGTAAFLEPRSSFKEWHEIVIGKCRDWSEEQAETAAVLCLVYGKFIEVWRQKEAALQNSRLTRLLLANSAHEVRTPLNAIINYLEIALEGSLDQETRENLAKSHSASKSLIYVINDLLDLTNMEEGQELIKDEIMDLLTCIQEATEPFKVDANRKGLSYTVVEHHGLPQYVHGDYRRVRQIIANMTANAMQHTTQGFVRVEAYVSEVLETRVRVEIVVQDTGRGMSNEKLDSLFQDLEQVSADADDSVPIDEVENPGEGRTLGLGLAVVARSVRNMNGQLRLKSEEGKGSRFVIQLPFELPTDEALEKFGSKKPFGKTGKALSIASVTKTLPSADADEVTLVDLPSIRVNTERQSLDEVKSISSARSGASNSGQSSKSDADRLIDAIQTPFALGEPDEQTASIQRLSSRERQDNFHPATPSLSCPNRAQPAADGSILNQQSTEDLNAFPMNNTDGRYAVTDTKTAIKPVKVPDEYFDQPTASSANQTSKVLFEIPRSPKPDNSPASKLKSASIAHSSKLQVLVAEDDPINMMLLQKRLEKGGHGVYHAVNGDDCATVFRDRPADFDVILMDMQMPIVDGLTSTKMIRAYENSGKCPGLSAIANINKRIPIFAVSASLMERDYATYVEAGFDGWILKPIDFKRLNVLLDGISNDEVRVECLYVPGKWEQGGWFSR